MSSIMRGLLRSQIILATTLTILSLAAGFVLLFARYLTNRPSRRRTAIVLVLGDIGRSPRMMYHASSFARHDWETCIVGYGDTPLIPSLLEAPHVHIFPLSNPPWPLLKLPWIFRAPIRIVCQIWSVLRITLWDIPIHAEVLLIQNPPSIPTLALAQLVAKFTGARLIIDWHNTGYSILAMRTGEDSMLVSAAKWFEATFGQKAFAHLFVTNALKQYLGQEWGLEGQKAVLHDRPPVHFRRALLMEKHELLHDLLPTLTPAFPNWLRSSSESVPFTSLSPSGQLSEAPDRPAILVSSTSWTADEDFTPLLQALDIYQKAKSSGKSLPRLLVLITGKGALRAPFEKAVAAREEKQWTDICVRCAFLPARDYPVVLGSADLGLSFHSSSSGRDLPMKVVDMFGCGLPVLAKNFEAVGELVKDGVNGRIWDNAEDLAAKIIDTLDDFPNASRLDQLQSYFESGRSNGTGRRPRRRKTIMADSDMTEDDWATWDENWDRVMYRGILQPMHC